MSTQTTATAPGPSRRIAAEIRAELARQGLSSRRLALALGVSYQWVNRRISPKADVDLTFEEVDLIAGAIGVPATKLVVPAQWLPRLDSNQQPFG
jgi:transcriptional regulator with XRE-family HTH domain